MVASEVSSNFSIGDPVERVRTALENWWKVWILENIRGWNAVAVCYQRLAFESACAVAINEGR